jgi:hypothetical protein
MATETPLKRERKDRFGRRNQLKSTAVDREKNIGQRK